MKTLLLSAIYLLLCTSIVSQLLIARAVRATDYQQANWPDKVTAVIDDAPPYRIIDGHSVSGIYVDIYELIMGELNVLTDYLEVPFPRALKMLQEGDADLMLGPIYSDARNDYIDYSLPAFPPVKKIFLVNIQKNVIREYADLSGKVIAVQRGSSYFRKFNQDTSLNKRALNDYAQAICMLKADRVDVVIIPEPIAEILLDKYAISVIRSPLYVPGDTSYIAISKKSPLRHFTKRIDKILKKAKQSQAYDEIFARYLNWDSNVNRQCPLT